MAPKKGEFPVRDDRYPPKRPFEREIPGGRHSGQVGVTFLHVSLNRNLLFLLSFQTFSANPNRLVMIYLFQLPLVIRETILSQETEISEEIHVISEMEGDLFIQVSLTFI